MNVTAQSKVTQVRHGFNIEFEGKAYTAIVWLDEKGKFADDEICYQGGDELDTERSEGEIRNKIIDFLDQNWDTLVTL